MLQPQKANPCAPSPIWSGFCGNAQVTTAAPRPTRLALAAAVGAHLATASCSPQAYTERDYRDADPQTHFAIVCHAGKRTIKVPAEEWPEHKAHGDYRGPCRAIGPAGPREPKTPSNTLTERRGRRDRKAWSEAEWARIQAAQAAAAKTAAEETREVGPTQPPD